DVRALDAAEFIENRPRAVAQPRSALPLLQRLPEHIGEEAHQDVRLDPLGLLMPDRPERELTLLDAEGRFGLRELHVRPPPRLSVPVGDIGAQHVTALAVPRPLGPLGPGRPLQAKPGRPGWIIEELNRVTARGPRVALEHRPICRSSLPLIGDNYFCRPARLVDVDHAAVERSAGVVDALGESGQRRLDPLREAFVHRLFLLPPLDGAAQYEGLAPSGPAHRLTSTP